jgi:hypothetical protein
VGALANLDLLVLLRQGKRTEKMKLTKRFKEKGRVRALSLITFTPSLFKFTPSFTPSLSTLQNIQRNKIIVLLQKKPRIESHILHLDIDEPEFGWLYD